MQKLGEIWEVKYYLNFPMSEQAIFNLFPKLSLDSHFRISSRKDVNYNCIAWAGIVDNEFWWPEVEPYNKLDGVRYKWPFNIKHSDKLEFFIELFYKLGYKEESHNIENEHPNFRKIALFIKEDLTNSDRMTSECSHAARQLKNGLWASKLGRFHDIEHSNPYDLEGKSYGRVAIILKKDLLAK